MDIFFVCDHDREIPLTIFHFPNEIVYVELCKLNILSVIFLSQIIRQKRKKTSRTQDYPDTFFNTISLAKNTLRYILSPCCSTSTGPSNKLKANTYLFTHSEKYNSSLRYVKILHIFQCKYFECSCQIYASIIVKNSVEVSIIFVYSL